VPNIRFMVSSPLRAGLLVLLGLMVSGREAVAQYVMVPGTGRKVAGDDFEDDSWAYSPRRPKSSRNLDRQQRLPLGVSSNGLWYESAKRGQPDIVKRVPTPEGGLPGSKGAMLMRTAQSGMPGVKTGKVQQDDLLFHNRHGAITVAWSPNVIVRVYVPPVEQWDPVAGSSFGFRAGVTAITFDFKRKGLFRRRRRITQQEMFYPGMFIQFSRTGNGEGEAAARFVIRADDFGRDFAGPKITRVGWWTLGMSFTPDGRVHYFAKEGVDDLTSKDRIASSRYGGVRFQTFQTMFFDVLSRDDGKSWSTPWVVDDPAVHLGGRGSTAQRRLGRRR